MFKTRTFSTLALALGMMAMPAVAQAQGQGQGQGYGTGAQQQMQGSPAAATIPDAKIEAFAAAESQVQTIAEDLRPDLQQAQTPEEQQEIQQQAEQRMIDAVQGEGLSVEEYNMIYEAAVQDPAVREAVRSHQ